jgi:FG-GAP-like repeat
MKPRSKFVLYLILMNLFFLLSFSNPVAAAVFAPVLKWQHGGCYSSWCETGWYASPAAMDLDGDGTPEVIAGSYSVFILNGTDGALIKEIDPAGGRIWPGVVVADLDGDDDPEIVTAHGGGYLHVFDHVGDPVWSRQPAANELRGLSVYDLDNDGTLEVIVNAAIGSKVNTWVYEHDGSLRSGWPQLDNDSGYAYGVFNDNAAIADLDNDGLAEIVVPSDVHYICTYDPDGVQLPANPIYGDKSWGKVGVWESLAVELQGWGTCGGDSPREERYRSNFAHGAAAISNVDGDGTLEVVVTGNVYDCAIGHPPGQYTGVYIFNMDRSRFQSSGFDWQVVPVDTGAPLSEDYNVIENCQPNPVVVDLDGDGQKEVLFASYDGRMHAFWLDKSEHGNWPYSVYQPIEGYYRFASEPVVVDLDGDTLAEVIFTSWVQKGTGGTGKLHILDYNGNMIHEVALPSAFGSPDWNGGLAAPTLANIDDDADLEVVINTAHSGVMAYDLTGTANARILWQTGRGNYYRNGFTSVAVKPCTADMDGDGDVDGSDIVQHLNVVSEMLVAAIAGNLGRTDCP